MEHCRSIQASACLDSQLFSTFKFEGFEDDQVNFCISLKALLHCLQIFGDEKNSSIWGGTYEQNILRVGVTCRMVYDGPGNPFQLLLDEAGVITICELTTYEVEMIDDIAFASNALLHRTIIKVCS